MDGIMSIWGQVKFWGVQIEHRPPFFFGCARLIPEPGLLVRGLTPPHRFQRPARKTTLGWTEVFRLYHTSEAVLTFLDPIG